MFKENYELLLDKLEIVDNKLMILAPTPEELNNLTERKVNERKEVLDTKIYANP